MSAIQSHNNAQILATFIGIYDWKDGISVLTREILTRAKEICLVTALPRRT